MSLNLIPAGKKIPDNIYVIIEIPLYSHTIKYEINKNFDTFFVDRFIDTTVYYPCNYGYINNTLSLDGDPLDVIIPISYKIQRGSVILCKPIGMLDMEDEKGKDYKIVAVPDNSITKLYKNIKNIYDISKNLLKKIIYFFSNYKKLEKKKWVKINGWKNKNKAKKEIQNSYQRKQKNK